LSTRVYLAAVLACQLFALGLVAAAH
jgi:hypothetical protein